MKEKVSTTRKIILPLVGEKIFFLFHCLQKILSDEIFL